MMRRIILLFMAMAMTLVVASGVALAVTKIGTDGPDTLMGTKGSDRLLGRGGIDWIEGRAGNDVISGGPGKDTPFASRTIGILSGGPGADVISGGPGADFLIDGPRSDSAVDILEGGEGNDNFSSVNFPVARDIVSCGAGRDYASVDRKDIVGDDCETVELVH